MKEIICENCGMENPPNAIYCNSCGEKLNKTNQVIVEKVLKNIKMELKICEKCGIENPNNLIYYNSCGEKLNEANQVNVEKVLKKIKIGKIKNVVLSVAILFVMIATAYFLVNKDTGVDTKKGIIYDNVTINEKQIFEYALEKANVKKDIIKNVTWKPEKMANQFTLVINIDKTFDEMAESDKFQTIHIVDDIFNNKLNEDSEVKRYSEGFMKYNGEIYLLEDVRGICQVVFKTEQHEYKFDKISKENFNDENKINFTDNFKIGEIKAELASSTMLSKVITESNSTTKVDNPKSDVSAYVSEYTHGQAGIKEVTVFVKNNSNKDIRYMKVNLFEKDKKSNKTIKSDWTNDSSIIKAGARQEIKTYFDFSSSESILDVELDEVDFK